MAYLFSSTPPTPRSHFQVHFYGAVLRLVRTIERMGSPGGASLAEILRLYPFLARYQEELARRLPPNLPANQAVTWWETQVTLWEESALGAAAGKADPNAKTVLAKKGKAAGSQPSLPLAALKNLPEVGALGQAAFMLCGLVEEDSRFGTLFAYLQEPLGARRPTLELLTQVLETEAVAGSDAGRQACAGLLHCGALESLNPNSPRSEWQLRVPGALWEAARGAESLHAANLTLHPAQEYPLPGELILPTDFRQRLEQAPQLLRDGRVRVLALRGSMGSDRLRVAGALARSMGRQVIEAAPLAARPVEGSDALAPEDRREPYLGVLCTLLHAAPVFSFDLGPGETGTIPDLPGYHGPVLVALGMEGGLRGPLADQVLALTIPTPGPDLRLLLWQDALGGTPAEDLPEIAGRFLLPAGYIRQVAGMAAAQAGLEKRAAVRLEDVRQASRALNRQLLDNLADRIEAGGDWEKLVVSSGTLDRLFELERRCRLRERLLDHLGPAFSGSANRGVRALFSGSSGTGKTLAARILAAVLGMDLYRVDLASIINKYIGETEKNLHRVLSRAEEMDIILLLDEGDSLLGSRTEVKSSNDRYANLETNYLLQRLEHYNGIILVTTNAAQNIDTAFQRRMDVVVNFVPPGAAERLAIWQLHLPESHAVSGTMLSQVAARCDLTGGQIRNAALLASLLAVSAGSPQVLDVHLQDAVRAEYRKAGAVCPLDGLPGVHSVSGPAFHLDSFARFLQDQPAAPSLGEDGRI